MICRNKKTYRFLLLSGCLVLVLNSSAQRQNNIWYFGQNAGINFNTSPPSPITPATPFNSMEASASCSDPVTGSLRFFTNSNTIWDKTGKSMPGSVNPGLYGDMSSTQGVLIVPKPCDDSTYFVFTTPEVAGAATPPPPGGAFARYTIVNLRLAGNGTAAAPLGDVDPAKKNVTIFDKSCEKITAVQHSNGLDYWIIFHEWETNNFRAYPLTSAGLGTAVVSAVGYIPAGANNPFGISRTRGQLKLSPDRTMLAAANEDGVAQVFKFDECTGKITSPIDVSTSGEPRYGVEFSPDSKKLYMTSGWGTIQPGNQLLQWDLSGAWTGIPGTKMLIATSGSPMLGALQLGPDGKIYVARIASITPITGQPDLGVVNSPNNIGTSCNYNDKGFNLGDASRLVMWGLPDFVANVPNTKTGLAYVDTTICIGKTATLRDTGYVGCVALNYSWTSVPPDPSLTGQENKTNPIVSPTITTTYYVKAKYACKTYYDTVIVNVKSCGITVFITGGTICKGSCLNVTATGTGGIAPYSYAWSPAEGLNNTSGSIVSACPSVTTTYTLLITDSKGATAIDTAVVLVTSCGITVSVTGGAVCEGSCLSLTAAGTGGITPYSYTWSPAEGLSNTSGSTVSACPSSTTTYTLIITDSKGITATDTAVVLINQPLSIATSSTPSKCGVSNGTATAIPSGGTGPFTYLWTTSPAQKSQTATGLSAGSYSVWVADAKGCTHTSTVYVTSPSSIVCIASAFSDTCGMKKGSVLVNPSGGTLPYTYLWLTSPVQTTRTAVALLSGTYTCVITDSLGCSAISSASVENIPGPTAEFCVTPNIASSTDPVFNFCNMWSKDVINWTWDFGDNSPIDSIHATPVHSYSATANQNDFYTYNVCIRVQNQSGCWDTTCHTVGLTPEFEFYIPNTFTPNGDDMNDMFYGKCRGVKVYAIWLFDRWGNQLWDCHHEDKNINWDSDATTLRQEGLSSSCKWDGVIMQGGADMGGGSKQLVQQDVYVWRVKLTDIFNKQHTYVGHVNVIR